MKTIQYSIILLLSAFAVKSQSLTGGNKNFGTLSNNSYYWFFSQEIKSNPLKKDKYEKVFYQTIYMDKDYNNDGIKDKGDWHIKTNNDITKNHLDYLLVTVPTINNFKGTEIEIYTDCYDCVVYIKMARMVISQIIIYSTECLMLFLQTEQMLELLHPYQFYFKFLKSIPIKIVSHLKLGTKLK